MPVQPAFFETQAIRRVYDEDSETWWFSVVDIVQALTQQPNHQTTRPQNVSQYYKNNDILP